MLFWSKQELQKEHNDSEALTEMVNIFNSGEMKMKTTFKFQVTLIRMSKINKLKDKLMLGRMQSKVNIDGGYVIRYSPYRYQLSCFLGSWELIDL